MGGAEPSTPEVSQPMVWQGGSRGDVGTVGMVGMVGMVRKGQDSRSF